MPDNELTFRSALDAALDEQDLANLTKSLSGALSQSLDEAVKGLRLGDLNALISKLKQALDLSPASSGLDNLRKALDAVIEAEKKRDTAIIGGGRNTRVNDAQQIEVENARRLADALREVVRIKEESRARESNAPIFKNATEQVVALENEIADLKKSIEQLKGGSVSGSDVIGADAVKVLDQTHDRVVGLLTLIASLKVSLVDLAAEVSKSTGTIPSLVSKVLGEQDTLSQRTESLLNKFRTVGEQAGNAFNEGFQGNSERGVFATFTDLKVRLEDLSKTKFEDKGFQTLAKAARDLVTVLDQLNQKTLSLEDVTKKYTVGEQTRLRATRALFDPQTGRQFEKGQPIGQEAAARALERLNQDVFTRLVADGEIAATKFQTAFEAANKNVLASFTETFNKIDQLLTEFAATVSKIVPKIFNFDGKGGATGPIPRPATRNAEAEEEERQRLALIRDLETKITLLQKEQLEVRGENEKASIAEALRRAESFAAGLRSIQNKTEAERARASTRAGGGKTAAGDPFGSEASQHLDDEIDQLQKIANLIIEIGKQSKITGVLILLKGPKEHFKEEARLLAGINFEIQKIGQQAKLAADAVGSLAAIDRLTAYQKALADVRAEQDRLFEKARDRLLNAEAASRVLEEFKRLKEELKSVNAEIKNLSKGDQTNPRLDELKQKALNLASLIKAFQKEADIAGATRIQKETLKFEAAFNSLEQTAVGLENKIKATTKVIATDTAKATDDAVADIDRQIKNLATTGRALADILTDLGRATRGSALTTGVPGGILNAPTLTPETDRILSKSREVQQELVTITQTGASERLKIIAAEQEKTVELIRNSGIERNRVLDDTQARLRQAIQKLGADEAKAAALREQLDLGIQRERERIQEEELAAIEKLKVRSIEAFDAIAKGQEDRIKRQVKNFEESKKAFEAFFKSFQGVRPLQLEGFGTGGGGKGPFDFGAIAGGVGKLPELFKSASGAIDPYLALLAKGTELTLNFVNATKKLIESALEFAKNQRQLSQAFSLNNEDLASFTLGFQRAGQPIFSLDIALSSLQSKIEAAFGGDEKASRAIERLGASAETTEGKMASLSDVLRAIGKDASTTADTAEKAAARVQLFGIFGQRAVGITLKSFEALRKEVRETGLALSEQSEGVLFEYFASVTRIEAIVQGLVNTIAADLAPAFTKFNTFIGDTAKALDLVNPQTVQHLTASLSDILTVIQNGAEVLLKAKGALDTIVQPLTRFAAIIEGTDPSKAGGFLAFIAIVIDGIAGVVKAIQELAFWVDKLPYRLLGQIIDFANAEDLKDDPPLPKTLNDTAKAVQGLGGAVDSAGAKIESFGTKVARLKREAEQSAKSIEETIARLQRERDEKVAETQRKTEEDGLGPVAAAKEKADAEISFAEQVAKLRRQQFEDEKKRLFELTGLSFEQVRQLIQGDSRRAQLQRENILEELRLREKVYLAEARRTKLEAQQAAANVGRFKPGQQVPPDLLQKAGETEIAAANAKALLLSVQESLAQVERESKVFAVEQLGRIQEQLDRTIDASKKTEQAESDSIKSRSKASSDGYKAAQTERDQLLAKGTASLEEALARDRAKIEEDKERGLISDKEAASRRVALEKEALEAQLKIRENFKRGAESSGPVREYDDQIKKLEERIRLGQDVTKEDRELLEVLREQRKAIAEQNPEYDRILEKVKQLKATRDAAPEGSTERARIEAAIAAEEAILAGHKTTNAQSIQNDEEIAKLRKQIALKSNKSILDDVRERERLIRIAETETAEHESRLALQREERIRSGNISDPVTLQRSDDRDQLLILQERVRIARDLLQLERDKAAGTAAETQAQDNLNKALLEEARLRREIPAREALKEKEYYDALAGKINEVAALKADELRARGQNAEAARVEFEAAKQALDGQIAAAEAAVAALQGQADKTIELINLERELAGLRRQRLGLEGGGQGVPNSKISPTEGIGGAINDISKTAAGSLADIEGATLDTINRIVAEAIRRFQDAQRFFAFAPPQIVGLFELQFNKAREVLDAALRKQTELQAAEEKRRTDEAIAERQRLLDSVKAIAERQAEAEKQAAERLSSSLADLAKQRADAIQDDADARLKAQEDFLKARTRQEEAFIQEDIDRARQAARERFDIELDFQRSLAQARFDAASASFSALRDFAKKDYELRQATADNTKSIQEAETAYRDQLTKVAEAKTRYDSAKTASEKEAARAALKADTDELNRNLQAIADLQKEREALRQDRENQAKLRALEKERSQKLTELFRRAARGEIDKDTLDLLTRQLNAQFDLQRDYLIDRNEAAKTGDAEYLRQIEDAYNDQKAALAALHASELAADATFRAEKKRRETEDEGLRQADRAKQRQDLVNSYNDQIKDLDVALAKRLAAIKENEVKVRAEYTSSLAQIKADSAKALAELGISYDKFFEDLVTKIKETGAEVAKVLASIGDLGDKLPKSGEQSASDASASSSTTTNPSVGGNPSIGPSGPGGQPTGPTATSGSQTVPPGQTGPTGGNPSSGPGPGGQSQPGATSSAGLPLRNKGQGGGQLAGVADNGNRLPFEGASSEVFANDIINKTTTLRRGERATPASAFQVLDFAVNPYHRDKDGNKVYEEPYISQADANRAKNAIKEFYQPANIYSLWKRKRISASYATGMIDDAIAAGIYGKQKADPQYTELRRRAWLENDTSLLQKYGATLDDVILGKITPEAAWKKCLERWKDVGYNTDLGGLTSVQSFLKQFFGYDAKFPEGGATGPYTLDLTKAPGSGTVGSDSHATGNAGGVGTIIQGEETGDALPLPSPSHLIVPKNPLQSDAPARDSNVSDNTTTDSGLVNLTSSGRKINKVGQKAKPLGKLPLGKNPITGGPGPSFRPKVAKGQFPLTPPSQTPNIPGSQGGLYNEAEGVIKAREAIAQVIRFIAAGHTQPEINGEINLAASKIINLGNKGLYKEPGGIFIDTYREALRVLQALQDGKYQDAHSPRLVDPALLASLSAESFDTGGLIRLEAAIPGPSPAQAPANLASLSTLSAATTPSVPSFSAIPGGAGGGLTASSGGLQAAVLAGIRDATPFAQGQAHSAAETVRNIIALAVRSGAKIFSEQFISDLSTEVYRR